MSELSLLTDRQYLVLMGLINGYSSVQIAQALGVTFGAVEQTWQRIARVAGCRNLALITRWAIRNGVNP